LENYSDREILTVSSEATVGTHPSVRRRKLNKIGQRKVGSRVSVDDVTRRSAGEDQVKDYRVADLEVGLVIVRLQANSGTRILIRPSRRCVLGHTESACEA
jgi:hypothetical protein